ncbi:hypothetical protein D3C85_1415750 [compost metagenome]
MADLGFLEVGLNPDVFIGHDRQQIRAGLYILAIARGTLADQATDRRVDITAGQVQFGLGQIGLGIGYLRVESFDFSGQRVDLLALPLSIRLGFGQLRAGDVVVSGEGGHALLRDITRLAQGFGAVQVDL